MNNIPPDWDFEIQALRDAATEAGIRSVIDPAELGIEFESADELIARLKASDASHDELAQRRTRRRRLSLIASSVAAVGVLVTGILQPWASAPVQAATPAILDYQFAAPDVIANAPGQDPAAALKHLAGAASAIAAQPKGSGIQHVVTDSWYAETDTPSENDNGPLIPQISESWLAPDGSLRIVERRGDPLPSDGRVLPSSGAWMDQPATADETQPAGSADPDLVASLPTDPDAMLATLLDLSGCTDTQHGTERSLCLLRQILALHQTYSIPSAVDAAFWQVLAGEKGFRSLGEVKDRAGRSGIGISLIAASGPAFRNVLIGDPETGRLLGSEQILIAPVEGIALEAPAIMSFTAILEAKYVD